MPLSSNPHPSAQVWDKKIKKQFFSPFYTNNLLEPILKTTGDNTEKLFNKNVFQGMLNIFYILPDFLAGGGSTQALP